MSKKSKKLKKAYKDKKAINIREVLMNPNWEIDNVDYDSNSGKYHIEATHKDGRKVSVKRNKQYVDNLITELNEE